MPLSPLGSNLIPSDFISGKLNGRDIFLIVRGNNLQRPLVIYWADILAALPSGVTFQTDGVNNTVQNLLNLIAGTNITLTPDGSGGVTIDATGGGGTYTVDNGLTENPAGNFQLGADTAGTNPFIHNTFIDLDTFYLKFLATYNAVANSEMLSIQPGLVQLGDILNSKYNTKISVDDIGRSIIMYSQTEILFDYQRPANILLIGNTQSGASGFATHAIFDGTLGMIKFKGDYISGNVNLFEIDVINGTWKIGDIDNDNNGTTFILDDSLSSYILNKLSGVGTRMVTVSATGVLGSASIPSGGGSPLTTKGDLYTFDTADARLPLGSNTQILTVDTSTATGLKWGTNTAPTPLGYYGAWQTDATQTAAVSNTGYAMKFTIADVTPNGISIVNNGSGDPTRITFANTGIYNIQFSSQFQNIDNAEHDVTVWLRLNGTDVTGSSGFVQVPKRRAAGVGNEGHVITGWNYVLSVVAGEYYELVWSTTDHVHVEMHFYAAGSPPPSAASVILTVTQQAGIMAGTGITAINSLTGSAQTLTVGTTGTDFAIVDSGVDHKFNLPTASALNRGALSSADWTTFNDKAPLASPAFTGSPTAPTQLPSDSSTKIATTAYVDNLLIPATVGNDLYLFYNY
jgi:hypothetical protein